jgi:hypothetical protein
MVVDICTGKPASIVGEEVSNSAAKRGSTTHHYVEGPQSLTKQDTSTFNMSTRAVSTTSNMVKKKILTAALQVSSSPSLHCRHKVRMRP